MAGGRQSHAGHWRPWACRPTHASGLVDGRPCLRAQGGASPDPAELRSPALPELGAGVQLGSGRQPWRSSRA